MYDVTIIGGGPGGYAAGIRAAQLGAKVALVEAAEIGGTCVNRGCIPTKVWQRAANLKAMISKSAEFGIDASVNKIDLSTIVERKTGVANDIKMGMGGLLGNNQIEVIQGQAVISSSKAVVVGDQTLDTNTIIIATGTSDSMPDIAGLGDAYLSTDELLSADTVPASVLVFGSGHVEVEMAAILNAFDAKVYLAFEGSRIIPEEDGETSQRIAGSLREQGIEIIPRVTLESVSKSGDAFDALLSGKKDRTLAVERVLMARRRANSADIGLEQAGVETDADGFITVDGSVKTSADGIYAVGDVTGGWMLSYAATVMGVVAAENAMGQDSTFSKGMVPRGIYTMPEAAAIGLSEDEAEDEGYEVETGTFPMSINGLAMAYGELEGAVKVVTDAEYGEVLGVHIVGAHATELIWGASLALQMEATAEDLARTIMVHPTFSESIAMSAQDSMGWALYLPKR